MNPLGSSFAIAALAAVAVAGVVAGYRRRELAPAEPIADPLEDRRLALERSLADLEEARGTGALEDDAYARLREETMARIDRVRRALERRDVATEPPADAPAPGPSEPRRVPAWAVALLLAAIVGATVVASLASEGAPSPQVAAPTIDADDPFAFFEERVRRNPEDVAARLDLAHRYLDAGMVEEALEHYEAVLQRDPDDAEALAHVGMILYLGDRPEEALASVDRALETDPDYPEALFVRGVILLRGLDRAEEAIETFERYLEAAPFGIERGTAQELIEEARAALAGDRAES